MSILMPWIVSIFASLICALVVYFFIRTKLKKVEKKLDAAERQAAILTRLQCSGSHTPPS